MLRLMGKGSKFRRSENFGACRDLNGRRLRHVNQELRLRKWASSAERQRRDREGSGYREAQGPDGLEGWFAGVPAWAEGFKKKARGPRVSRYKIQLCRDWLEARKDAKAPSGAPPWWGCSRGRQCRFAHGAEELRGDGKKAYDNDQTRQRRASHQARYCHHHSPQYDTACHSHVVACCHSLDKHAAETQAVTSTISDAVLAGMR